MGCYPTSFLALQQARCLMLRPDSQPQEGVRLDRVDDTRDHEVRGITEIYAPFSFEGDTYRARLLMKMFSPE